MAQVNWTIQAIEDIESVAEFISHNSVRYAAAFIEKAFDRVKILKTFPKAGRMVPEIERDDIRELIMEGRYRIIYRLVDNERIDVLTVHSSARPLPRDSRFD